LYWDFFDRHRTKLSANFRLSMVYRTLDKMNEETLTALRIQANQTLAHIESL
jgi:deoxyribodipyrimidine photolyase-related protein